MAKSSIKQKNPTNGNYAPGVASDDSMLREFFEDEVKDMYWV